MPRVGKMPDQPDGWNFTVEDYLARHGIDCDRAIPLNGGLSAYVWRLDGVLVHGNTPVSHHGNKKTEPCVLKYGDTTIKAAPEIEPPRQRMLMEARALQSSVVAVASSREPSVQVPSVLHTTGEAIIMSWAGDATLWDAYRKQGAHGMEEIGRRVGRWIGALHLAGIDAKDEVADWKNAWSESIAKNECDHMRRIMSDRGDSEHTVSHAVAFFNDTSVVQTLTPWDFRPMNTLLRACEDVSQAGVLTIVDWECSTCGDPALDIRLWVAETLLLESQCGRPGETPLLDFFLVAYRETVGASIIDDAFVCRVAVFLGSILNFTLPFEAWDCTEPAEVKRWKDLGLSFITAGANADIAWLRASALGSLMAS